MLEFMIRTVLFVIGLGVSWLGMLWKEPNYLNAASKDLLTFMYTHLGTTCCINMSICNMLLNGLFTLIVIAGVICMAAAVFETWNYD